MDPMIPYIACLIGAAVLYVLVRPPQEGAVGKRIFRGGAGIVGLAAFGWLMMESATRIGGEGERPGAFFMIFSLIAVCSAVRMITHSRPVYSALYFVMVVLSSAGLFLLLHAEFMAFALIIVYAGAILITYMFVLMLAQQAATPDNINEQPAYDRIPREPAAAVVVGFIMLALLTSMIYGSFTPEGQGMLMSRGVAERPEKDIWSIMELPEGAEPDNIQRVGVALVYDFPVSLELAGVILLMAMFGAVVLARRQIELGEMELHALVGMAHYGDEGASEGDSREIQPDEPGNSGIPGIPGIPGGAP